MHIDIRHAILPAINMLKYGVGMPWDWVPFHTISNPTWISVQIVFFVIFPFISIKIHVPLTTHHLPPSSVTSTTADILVFQRLEELSAPLAVALAAAVLVLPQALFWYAYPFITLIPSFFYILSCFVIWLYTVLSTIPVLDIVLRATIVGWRGAFAPEPDRQINEPIEGDAQETEMRAGDAMEDLEAGGLEE